MTNEREDFIKLERLLRGNFIKVMILTVMILDQYIFGSSIYGIELYLISNYGFLHTGITVRIKIISPDKNPFLPSRDSEWSYASHNIADYLTRLESLHKALMFCL